MKLKYLINYIKNIYRRFFQLDLIYTFICKVRRIGCGEIYINKGCYLQLNESAKLIIEDTAEFTFNAYWHKRDAASSNLILEDNAKLIIIGSTRIFSGARVCIHANANLVIGWGYINHNLNLNCFENIEIGNHVFIGDNATIRDSDNHKIKGMNHIVTQPIKIGDHVWIGMNVTILKGVTIGNGAIIAAGSVVTKSIPENCLAGGVPAKILKYNVEWE